MNRLSLAVVICLISLTATSTYAIVWPISNSRRVMRDTIVSPFGPRYFYNFHAGLDIRARTVGTIVHAAEAGQVISIGEGGERGRWVLLVHFQGSPLQAATSYFHLSNWLVDEFTPILEGMNIALSGATGNPPVLPHLHFGFNFRCPDQETCPCTEYPWCPPHQHPLRFLPTVNRECPWISFLNVVPPTGNINYVELKVRVDANPFLMDTLPNKSELDGGRFQYYLYQPAPATPRTVLQHFESFLNVSDATGGVFTFFQNDPIFETTVTINVNPFDGGDAAHTYNIKIDPSNNTAFHNDQYMGFLTRDLFGTTDCFHSSESKWGNTSGVSPSGNILNFVVKPKSNNVLLEWQLDENLPIDGVNVYRSEQQDKMFVKINADLISTTQATGGHTYTYVDGSIAAGKTYSYRLELVGKEGASLQPEVVSIHIPAEFSLQQNYPNPFNSNTVIQFGIAGPGESEVELSIFNMLGQRVRRLAEGTRPEGEYQIEWDGRDDFGNRLPSGIYFYKLKAGNFIETKKLVLVK